MAIATEVARLRRATDELVAGVTADLKSKTGISPVDRTALRAEIERCTQALDELRSKLSTLGPHPPVARTIPTHGVTGEASPSDGRPTPWVSISGLDPASRHTGRWTRSRAFPPP